MSPPKKSPVVSVIKDFSTIRLEFAKIMREYVNPISKVGEILRMRKTGIHVSVIGLNLKYYTISNVYKTISN